MSSERGKIFVCTFALMKKAFTILAALSFCLGLAAQTDVGGVAHFDRTVHDFGDVILNSGPVSCSFSVRNISQNELTINSVVSSCGCTGVKWTRSAINPGEEGRIEATYSNDEGAYPFDKTLTVYLSGVRKPVILHIRGVVREKKRPLAESYPVHYGGLALRSSAIEAGNLSQGEQKSGEISVANISKQPLTVEFKDVSEGLKLRCADRTIPAGGVSSIIYTVTSDRSRWGGNWYYATPVVNGKVHNSKGREKKVGSLLGTASIVNDGNPELGEGCSVIGFTAVTREDFRNMTKTQLKQAPVADFKETTCDYGKLKAGSWKFLTFDYSNSGGTPLEIYKVDSPSAHLQCVGKPAPVAASSAGRLSFRLDTAGMEPGERLFVVNLYTNSPAYPVISLYVTGIVE